MAAARDGDRVYQQRLYDRFAKGVFHYALSLTRDPDAAADLTQETFVRALTTLPRLRHDRAWRGWLFRIATNLARDQAAKSRPTSTDDPEVLDQPDERSDPAGLVAQSALAMALRMAVDRLPAHQREVIVLHHFEELSIEEIGAALGLRAGTVKSRLGRARAALHRDLAAWMEEPS